jgi:hypothetical protein
MADEHFSFETDTDATIKEFLEAAFSQRSMPKLYSKSYWEKLVNSSSELDTFGAMGWVRGSRQAVTTRAERDIVGIYYQAKASKDKLRRLHSCCSES